MFTRLLIWTVILLAAAAAGHYLWRLDWERVGVSVEQPPPAQVPDAVSLDRPPYQLDLGSAGPRFRIGDFKLTALAAFSLAARVLLSTDYSGSIGSGLASIDLALGWGRMADPDVSSWLSMQQYERFYYYSFRYPGQPPVPMDQVRDQSANMHMIPATREIRENIKRSRWGQVVRFKGYLVEARAGAGFYWRSSLTRSDSGDGACEVVFVQEFTIEK